MIDGLKVVKMVDRNDGLNVNRIEPIDMCKGMEDCIRYVCERFNVESTSKLNDDEWAHAVSEYIASLSFNMKDFRKFAKRFSN